MRDQLNQFGQPNNGIEPRPTQTADSEMQDQQPSSRFRSLFNGFRERLNQFGQAQNRNSEPPASPTSKLSDSSEIERLKQEYERLAALIEQQQSNKQQNRMPAEANDQSEDRQRVPTGLQQDDTEANEPELSEMDRKALEEIDFVRCNSVELDGRFFFCDGLTDKRLGAVCKQRFEALVKFCVDKFDTIVRHHQLPDSIENRYTQLIREIPDGNLRFLFDHTPMEKFASTIRQYLMRQPPFNLHNINNGQVRRQCAQIVRDMDSAETVEHYSGKELWQLTESQDVQGMIRLYEFCTTLVDPNQSSSPYSSPVMITCNDPNRFP